MILNNTPENKPVLSNVGEIGEFRIRNSAKAFGILSSGLYANKIRAIIRELSCNAVDSHAAAGCADRPFEVHLPNALEPWFSIRDYGVGLSHDQVINIYTTYFESTKTDSNEFIGALGLGSKSPFSYTENFSVTAIHNGRQGIYTAFINAQGVPSIALMTESTSDQPNGVEVKFSVNDRNDYNKFRTEAAEVYSWFAQQPKITGTDVTIKPMQYERMNLIPGVHVMKNVDYYGCSYAVMGNIAYPIDVPSARQVLGPLEKLLSCGLVMQFGIGELDFQASREGLSYIPHTVEAIRQRLAAVNDVLSGTLKQEAEAIANPWERVYYLSRQQNSQLWNAAANQYMKSMGTTMSELLHRRIDLTDMLKFNIQIKCFRKGWRDSLSTQHPDRDWSQQDEKVLYWNFGVSPSTQFVINDTRTGAFSRAKYHWRSLATEATVYVLEPVDRKAPMLTEEFFTSISNPPESQRHLASALDEPERKQRAQGRGDVTILQLERRGGSGRWSTSDDLVWREALKLSEFNDTVTHYYVPLTGFEFVSKHGIKMDAKGLLQRAQKSGIRSISIDTLYGVRKADLDQVQALPNWKNFEDHVSEQLTNPDEKAILAIVRENLNKLDHMLEQIPNVVKLMAADSPMRRLCEQLRNVQTSDYNSYALQVLITEFKADQLRDRIVQASEENRRLMECYPLLESIQWSVANPKAVADYINLMEAQKAQ